MERVILKPKRKSPLKSKIILLSAVVAAVGAVQAHSQIYQEFLTPEQQGYATIGLAALYAFFRALTDTSILGEGREEADEEGTDETSG